MGDVNWKSLKNGEVLSEELAASNSALVTVEGYVGNITPGIESKEGVLRIRIFEKRHQREAFYLDASITNGTDPNQANLKTDDPKDEDLIIIADDGTELQVGDPIRLTGIYGWATSPKFKWLHDVSKIEKKDVSFDASMLDEAEELTDEVIEDDANSKEMTYNYLEGVLGDLSPGSSMKNGYSVKFDPDNNSHIEYVTIRKGGGPSSAVLPEVYMEGKPFTIYDYQGKKANSTTPVRLYGTFHHGIGHGKGTFYVEEIMFQ